MNNNSQTNGIGLTSKVKNLLQDQLEHEKLCVDKYTEYASKAKDPQLSQLFTDIASCEQKHYDSIQSMLNGTIPNVASGGSGGGSSSNSTGMGSTNSTGMSGSTNSTGMSSSSTNSTSMSGMTNNSTSSSTTGTGSTNSTSGNSSGGTNYTNSTSSTTSSGNTSYTNSTSTSGGMTSGKTGSKKSTKNSYSNSKASSKNHGSHSYNYPPQSTLSASTKSYNEKQPATAQNPVMAADSIFSGYTGGGSMGSYVNQADGNSLLRSYENTMHPDDLVVGSGGISYGSYGATTGGPTYDNSTSMTTTGGSYNSSSQTTNNTSSNTTGTTSSNSSGTTSSTSSTSSGGMGDSKSVTDCDKKMCQDLLMTEKHISKNYDTTIFECSNTQMRSVLNHIQKEEQEHGDKLYNYMHQKGWY